MAKTLLISTIMTETEHPMEKILATNAGKWTGRILTALPALALTMSAGM